jgi:hypothetical protein
LALLVPTDTGRGVLPDPRPRAKACAPAR